MSSYRVKLVAYRIASNIPISPSSIGQMHLCVGWALAIDLAHHPAKVHFFVAPTPVGTAEVAMGMNTTRKNHTEQKETLNRPHSCWSQEGNKMTKLYLLGRM